MAITFTGLTSGAGSGSSGTTASISPPGSKPIYAVIGNAIFAGTAGTVSLSGNGLTWTEIATVTFSGNQNRITVLRGLDASPSSGTVTITVSGALQNGLVWAIFYADSADTSGTNGSGSVVQSVTGTTSGDSPNAFSVTLSALTDASNNAVLGCFANDNSTATNSPSSGYTELYDQASGGSGGIGIGVHYKVPGTTTPGTTVSQDFADVGGIGIEIKAASSGAATTNFLTLLGAGT